MPPAPTCCGPRTLYYILQVGGIVGAVASGLYTTYMLMWEYTTLRWAIMYFYLTVFSFAIIIAELGFLQHKAFHTYAMFLTTYTGRGLFYIFMGGLLLKDWGIVVGIYMFTMAILNIGSVCCYSDNLKEGQPKVESASTASTPSGGGRI